MFCPNCGANNLTEQKFCRACGLNIEESAASLQRQIPSAESAEIMRQKQRWETFGSIAWNGFIIVVCWALLQFLYLIFEKFILSGANVIFGIIAILFLIFGVATLVYVYKSQEFKENGTTAKTPEKDTPELVLPTAKLLEDRPFEPVPSITEDSTDLLLAGNRRRNS